MPFVVKHAGEYLVRPASGVRRFTITLSEATTWRLVGHAKNAIHEMFRSEPDLVSIKATLEIVQVHLAEGVIASRVRRKADRYGRMTAMEVV